MLLLWVFREGSSGAGGCGEHSQQPEGQVQGREVGKDLQCLGSSKETSRAGTHEQQGEEHQMTSENQSQLCPHRMCDTSGKLGCIRRAGEAIERIVSSDKAILYVSVCFKSL